MSLWLVAENTREMVTYVLQVTNHGGSVSMDGMEEMYINKVECQYEVERRDSL